VARSTRSALVILCLSPNGWVPYPVLARLPRSFLQGQEGVVGLRIEQDALPFIVPHDPAIRPENPPRDRLKRRAPLEPASATALLPSLRLRAFGLGFHIQAQLNRRSVSLFAGHLRLRPRRRGEPAGCRIDTCEEKAWNASAKGTERLTGRMTPVVTHSPSRIRSMASSASSSGQALR